jgi:hypothetical protein
MNMYSSVFLGVNSCPLVRNLGSIYNDSACVCNGNMMEYHSVNACDNKVEQ